MKRRVSQGFTTVLFLATRCRENSQTPAALDFMAKPKEDPVFPGMARGRVSDTRRPFCRGFQRVVHSEGRWDLRIWFHVGAANIISQHAA